MTEATVPHVSYSVTEISSLMKNSTTSSSTFFVSESNSSVSMSEKRRQFIIVLPKYKQILIQRNSSSKDYL